MKTIRIVGGVVLMLAGVVGLIVCGLAIREIHGAAEPVATQTTNILKSAEEGVRFVKRGTAKSQLLFGDTKTRVKGLDAVLKEIDKKIKANPSGRALLDSLDPNVSKQLQRAQSAVVGLQSTLEGFSNALVLFNSVPSLLKPVASEEAKQASETQDLTRSVQEATEALDQLAQFLNEILTDKEVTQQSLTRATGLVDQIHNKLGDTEKQVGTFQQRLTIAEERLASSRQSIPVWIDRGSIAAIVLLVCFAFTQIGMIVQGGMLVGRAEE
ncbi:MAG: hypothetical protein FJ303_14705 [Planctomycetes bacterium]|nr:hypothetical protein [Planctomycetota bacterium]